jgi:hypothetical protein
MEKGSISKWATAVTDDDIYALLSLPPLPLVEEAVAQTLNISSSIFISGVKGV